MNQKHVRLLAVLLTSAIAVSALPARADPIRTITSGTVQTTGLDAADVVLNAPGFFLSAHLYEGIGTGSSCIPCAVGEGIRFRSAWGGDISAKNVVAQVNGQPARSVFLGGFLELDGGSAIVPETEGSLLIMQRSFSVGPDSFILGWDDPGRTIPLFNVPLGGIGTVTMTAQRFGSLFHVQSLTWVFNTQQSPVPEPGSALLLLTGLGGLASAWRRRNHPV